MSRFADLMRSTLEMSEQKRVSLQDELEIASAYIELEALLQENDFTCKKEIDPKIDLALVMVPPLLLQPFIENVFKHAFPEKTGKKLLSLSVRRVSNESIEIEISDNGIGRKASEERKRKKKHLSFATKATEKRLDLLNFEKANYIQLSIHDRTDSNGEPIGTTVLIQIQIK